MLYEYGISGIVALAAGLGRHDLPDAARASTEYGFFALYREVIMGFILPRARLCPVIVYLLGSITTGR